MITTIHGFGFKHGTFPKAVAPPDLLDYLRVKGGQSLKTWLRVGADFVTVRPSKDKEERWVAGIVLRVRDADAFTTLEKQGDKLVLRTTALEDGTQLAEPSFFIAHPTTGGMFYASHRGAASMGMFANVCLVFLRTIRDHKRGLALADIDDDAEIKAIRDAHIGQFEWDQLYRDEGFKMLIKKLRTVNSFEATFRTSATRSTFLQAIRKHAEVQQIKFLFEPDAQVDELAEAIVSAIKDSPAALENVAVRGKDEKGAKTVHLTENPLVFDSYKYGEAEANLAIDLSDWSTAIAGNPTIERLIKLAQIPAYRLLVAS